MDLEEGQVCSDALYYMRRISVLECVSNVPGR